MSEVTPLVPPRRDPKDFEHLPANTFLTGTLSDVEYEAEHQFTGQYATVGPAVRLSFTVDGYKFPHKTYWMKFNYHEKSNLFKKYLVPLVAGIKPYAEFNLRDLIGMRVKMIWQDNGDFQNLSLVTPLDQPFLWVKAPGVPDSPAKGVSSGPLLPQGSGASTPASGNAYKIAKQIHDGLMAMANNDEAEAEEHLKVLSCYLDADGGEHYLTMADLFFTDETRLARVLKKVLEAITRSKKK